MVHHFADTREWLGVVELKVVIILRASSCLLVLSLATPSLFLRAIFGQFSVLDILSHLLLGLLLLLLLNVLLRREAVDSLVAGRVVGVGASDDHVSWELGTLLFIINFIIVSNFSTVSVVL